MCHEYLRDTRFFHFLVRVDRSLAATVREARCPFCGGRLHVAHYPRKPRGALVEMGVEFSHRFSFCCSREGCRRRATPPSVRFLGPKVYLGVVVVLITALRQGASPTRLARLQAELDVDPRTLAQWQQWWREEFPQGRFWRQTRHQLFPHTPDNGELPQVLIEVFDGMASRRNLVRCLRFLAPVTTPLEISEHARVWPG